MGLTCHQSENYYSRLEHGCLEMSLKMFSQSHIVRALNSIVSELGINSVINEEPEKSFKNTQVT